MPNADSKKRSRSPSAEADSSSADADKHHHKKANVGEDAAHPKAAPVAAPPPDGKDDAADANGNGNGKPSSVPAKPEGASTSPGKPATPTGAMIHMRCLIVTQDASIIIGKGGAHVNEIREKSGARVVVSESIPGNPERILNVSGPLDAVSKAFGLIVRRINDEPFDVPSVPGSRAVTIKFMIPNSRMGSVIGKGGVKIKEIQEASGARLNASEGVLPGSTERVLSVAGVADAIHIATYYIGNILLEAQAHGGAHTNHASYRPAPAYHQPPPQQHHGAPGPFAPHPHGPPHGPPAGPYGAPGPYGPPGPYGAYPPPHPQQGRPGPGPGPGGPGPGMYPPPGPVPYGAPAGAPPPPPGAGAQLQTQQIFIPNDLVGCIIGKGGSKINEIRQLSASTIKIMEPGVAGDAGGGPNERLVTITGASHNIQMAVSLLYQRLEQEKQKQIMQGGRK